MAAENNNPSSLYDICLVRYVSNLNYNVTTMDSVNQLQYLPPVVLMDIYFEMALSENLESMLYEQLSNLEIFARLLRLDSAREELFQCQTRLISKNKPLAKRLQDNYIMRYRPTTSTEMGSATSDQILAEDFDMKAIDLGLRLGSFFSEAGWLSESASVLACVASRIQQMPNDRATNLVRLDCLQRLLHTKVALCNFKSADYTFKHIIRILPTIAAPGIPMELVATIFTQISALFFARSEFTRCQKYSAAAIRSLNASSPDRVVIDVLRQAAKACVVKRDFQRANMLICEATRRARDVFGIHHQKYADTLLDYGFFLVNVDSVSQGVKAYSDALEIKSRIFGRRNYHVAMVHEDLAYGYYVKEYSTGDFSCARRHVDEAVDIMKDLVPSDHMMLASAKRVKALLLEEIALDKMAADGVDEDGLLKQSEELHMGALRLSLEVFGEVNVQTAKHYGNLGRLYQTMSKFEEAEKMHLKAIKIKTDLLGPYDYEVGLSIGHLASLYNYQMKKYDEAEALYLRSIDISLRLFGKTYSGLEYDYLGLCHVYETLYDFQKYVKYATILENWQLLRGENNALNKPRYPQISEINSLAEVQRQYFDMCKTMDKTQSSVELPNISTNS